MRRLLILATLAACPVSQAATILERGIDVAIGDGRVLTTEKLLVEIDRPGDVESWSRYPIHLNEHVELTRCTAEVLDGRGKVVAKIPMRDHHREESTGFGLYSSAWASIIPFPPLTVGQKLRIDYTTREKPYFPVAEIQLGQGWPQRKLAVRVQSEAGDIRWWIDDSGARFHAGAIPGGLDLAAEDVPEYSLPPNAPRLASALPFLRVAWGPEQTWTDVGIWYERLLADLPRGSPDVAAVAGRLSAGLTSPRERVKALSDYVRTAIRYEAVEIGAGGYVPTPPAQVMQRAWGDCKDKANLLGELLAAIQVPSHLVLLYSGGDGALPAGFPSPYAFNHAILGIPAGPEAAFPREPMAEEILFVDPTWEKGTMEWLAAADRGRDVLVVDGERSRLVRIPAQPDAETGDLDVTGAISPSGDLNARVRLELRGTIAIAWLEDLAARPMAENESDFRQVIGARMAGSRVSSIQWDGSPSPSTSPAPALAMEAEMYLPRMARGSKGRRALRATALTLFPESRLLDDRKLPVILTPARRRSSWRLQLPAGWCPVTPLEERTDNPIGYVRTVVASDAENEVTIVREVGIRRSRVEPGDFDSLRELSVAESRADNRQIRLRCPDEPPDSPNDQ